jgi:hypothetical protein
MEQTYFNNCGNLQDYIFKSMEFMKNQSIDFEEEVLMIFNESIIEIENENTEINNYKLMGINEDINDYIMDSAIDSFHEYIEVIEDYIEIVID